MTGGPNNRFDRQVRVTSEWITVHYNQYTNVDQLHESKVPKDVIHMLLRILYK